MPIKAVIFDFIGTTAIESDPNVITHCFVNAFMNHGLAVEERTIKANRGKDKKVMIETVLSEKGMGSELIQPILHSFQDHLQNRLDNFSRNEGADDIFHYLKERRIHIGLGSGLPRDIFEAILHHLGWSENDFDYIGIAEEIGKSRPDPVMLFDVMSKLKIGKEELLKVGDTVADIQEGKNAGVMTMAILSGTQEEKEIVDAGPDFIIRSLMELVQIIR